MSKDYGRLTLVSYPECPECQAPWQQDHRDGGHCPGRPEGCTCQCDMQYHREPSGCGYRGPWREGPVCWCRYRQRPVDWSGPLDYTNGGPWA